MKSETLLGKDICWGVFLNNISTNIETISTVAGFEVNVLFRRFPLEQFVLILNFFTTRISKRENNSAR